MLWSMLAYPDNWCEYPALRLVQHRITGRCVVLYEIGLISPLWLGIWRVRLYNKARSYDR